MKSNMTVNVEFLAGTCIDQAISEAKAKCIEWDVAYVCFKFNGVKMSISCRCNVKEAVEDFHKAMNDDIYGVVG